MDTRGKPRVEDRRVISGIVHVLRSGCRWKDAPFYGPRKTLFNCFVRWAHNASGSVSSSSFLEPADRRWR
jgi:transposase